MRNFSDFFFLPALSNFPSRYTWSITRLTGTNEPLLGGNSKVSMWQSWRVEKCRTAFQIGLGPEMASVLRTSFLYVVFRGGCESKKLLAVTISGVAST